MPMPFNNDSFNRQFQTTHFIHNNHVTNLGSQLNSNNYRHHFDSNLPIFGHSQATNSTITTFTTLSNSSPFLNIYDVTNNTTHFPTQRVQVQLVQTTCLNVNYNFPIIQNQTTQLLNSASTRDRFLGQYFQNPRLTHQNPRFYQTDPPNNPTWILNPQPLNVHFPDESEEVKVNDGSDDVDFDGMTHSLPCKKYGPYTCPRCNGVFSSSQTFAAHIGSHYKGESAEQRRKRRLAKQRGRSKSVFKINGGIRFKRELSSAAGIRIANHVPNRVVVVDDGKVKKEESGWEV